MESLTESICAILTAANESNLRLQNRFENFSHATEQRDQVAIKGLTSTVCANTNHVLLLWNYKVGVLTAL